MNFLTLLKRTLLVTILLHAHAYADDAFPTYKTNSKINPVLLVHGWEMYNNAKTDCAKKFKDIIDGLKNEGFTGPFVTVGYYKKDTHCSINLNERYGVGRDSTWKEIGAALSNAVYDDYTQFDQTIDLVGHSMGGLIIRSALQGSEEGLDGFAQMMVEDVVTVATPHKGSAISAFCIHKQCKTLSPNNPDFAWLALNQSPQSNIPTDWTLLGSTWDMLVHKDSSMGMALDCDHKVLSDYLTHNNQLTNANSIRLIADGLKSYNH